MSLTIFGDMNNFYILNVIGKYLSFFMCDKNPFPAIF